MAETSEQKLFNRKETLAEVIESMFSVKGSGFWTVIKVVLGIASIGWLADSILPFLQGLAMLWWTGSNPAESNFTTSFYKLSLPLLWFILYIGILFSIRYGKIKALEYKIRGSVPHRGLIISLSPYSSFLKISLEELEKAIDEKKLDIEEFFNSSNWGQLAFTVAHHSYLLQKCWICTTSISSEQFPVAAKLVNYVSQSFEGREIVPENQPIKDENDISEMARKVSEIYRGLESIDSSLKPADVISNYTGGTAAMSGGMIMATLNENRKIEYINQKFLKKLSKNLLPGIEENLAIVTSETNLVVAEKLN